MNKVNKLLLDIKLAEAKLEYAISRGDEDDTIKYIAGWDYAGDFLIYATNNGQPGWVHLSPAEAKRFAEWILDMLEDEG